MTTATSNPVSGRVIVDWQQVETVLLDMDGTLLDLHFDDFFWGEYLPRCFAEREGLDLATARERMRPWFRAVEGTLDWYCLDHWGWRLSLDLMALKRQVSDRIAVLPHVPDFLDAVRVSGRRLLLVTNAHPDSLALKLERTGLGSRFDRVISSHDYDAPKESQQFWRNLCQREGITAPGALFVDDSPAVLQSARDFGIGHVLAMQAPDSRGTVREVPDFAGIRDFRGLTRELARQHASGE